MATEYIGLPDQIIAGVREAAAKESMTSEDFCRDAVETRLRQAERRELLRFGSGKALEWGLLPADVEAEISAIRAEQIR